MFHISRRDLVLGAAGAYAAFGLTKPIAFIGAAEAQQSPAQGFRKYKVGDIVEAKRRRRRCGLAGSPMLTCRFRSRSLRSGRAANWC